jgi:hypothetical protein
MPASIPGLAANAFDTGAHAIQVALTPVFLLSGIGTLLNVFNTRLARVSDHSEHVNEQLAAAPDEAEAARMLAHSIRLHRRILALDASIVLSAVGAGAICCSVFALFVGGLRDEAGATVVVVLFGVALCCTLGALVAFVADSVLAWHGLRREGPLPRPKKE